MRGGVCFLWYKHVTVSQGVVMVTVVGGVVQ